MLFYRGEGSIVMIRKDGFPFPVFTRTGFMGMTCKEDKKETGSMNRTPTLERNKWARFIVPPSRWRKYEVLVPPFQGRGEVK